MAVRKRPASKPPAIAAEPAPEWVNRLMSAAAEGAAAAGAALSQRSKFNKFWMSGGNVFDLARDPVEGDVLLRVGADVTAPCALDLATLAGMLMAAAAIQGAFEEDEGVPF